MDIIVQRTLIKLNVVAFYSWKINTHLIIKQQFHMAVWRVYFFFNVILNYYSVNICIMYLYIVIFSRDRNAERRTIIGLNTISKIVSLIN